MSTRKKTLGVWDRAAREADLIISLPREVPMFFRRIEAGRFRMGARGYYSNEEPVHEVRLTEDFYLGTFVVTQEQYRTVARWCPALRSRSEPSIFKGKRRPVENVSWEEVAAWCDWLSHSKTLPKGWVARLPTEAEWEYACRKQTETEYYSGDGEAALGWVGWYDANSGNQTHPVDEKDETHPFGLFGMHGNVWEWCLDAYESDAYRRHDDADENPGVNPSEEDRARVVRGGSWYGVARTCRSAYRIRRRPDGRDRYVGFRVCLVGSPMRLTDYLDQPAKAAPGPGDGGRGTRPESDGPGTTGAGPAAMTPRPAKAKTGSKVKVKRVR
ncbi:MAG TPA: formylglycine-generating enzyme family protein [Candidatus Limnocylindria bacterium]|nr:formylglycine-generating enzyme family protein [Candidatus Limnocylindria bacterium]